MKILSRLITAALAAALLYAIPAEAANQTLTVAAGTLKIIDSPTKTTVRLIPASLTAGTDTAFAVVDMANYLKPVYNSSAAPVYTVYQRTYGWSTGVDSTRCGLRSGPTGVTSTTGGWKTLFTEANTADNEQRPTSPTNDKVAINTLTITAADVARFFQFILINGDGTSAGTVIVEYDFMKAYTPR